MPNKILLQEQDGSPKQIVFADHSGDFGPAAANDLRITTDGSKETDIDMALVSLADGAARQSDKADLGEHRARAYKVRACFEFESIATGGEVVEAYWAPSLSGTAANGNPGGVSGSDSAYTGQNNLATSIKQLDFIGNFICDTYSTFQGVQVAEIGILQPSERYGTLVIKNECGAAMHSDDIEAHVTFNPIVEEIQ